MTIVRTAILLMLMMAVPHSAAAAIIGDFAWVYDPTGSGSTFSVLNESTADFEGASVTLYAPGATIPFMTFTLGNVTPDLIPTQSSINLSFLLVPEDLNQAVLTFTFLSQVVTTELLASDLAGDPNTLLEGSADIVSTPEPSSLGLLLLGAALGGRRLRRARSNA